MSKKIFVSLIIGIIFLAGGIAVSINYLNIIQEKYPDVIVFFEGELKQEELFSSSIELSQGDDTLITILSPSSEMYFSLTGPDSSTLVEQVFLNSLEHRLVAKTNGTHTISVGNMDDHSVNVMGILSEQSITDEEFVISISYTIVAGTFLILIGTVIVIVSIVILVIKKNRSKKNSKDSE